MSCDRYDDAKVTRASGGSFLVCTLMSLQTAAWSLDTRVNFIYLSHNNLKSSLFPLQNNLNNDVDQ